jgi:hypothetical protein
MNQKSKYDKTVKSKDIIIMVKNKEINGIDTRYIKECFINESIIS